MLVRVDDNVWRGSRPVPSDFAQIKSTFATIISLEGQAEDQKEAKELAPVPLASMPVSAWDIYVVGISQGELYEILNMIYCAHKPVLVHCQHGQDRTGLVIAAYRVTFCGWTKEAAMEEALHYGYRRFLNFGLNKTWRDFRS